MKRLNRVRKIAMIVNTMLTVSMTYVFLVFFVLALAAQSEPAVLRNAVFGLMASLAVGLGIVGAMAFRDYIRDWWDDGVKVKWKGLAFLIVATTVLEMQLSAILDIMIGNHYAALLYGVIIYTCIWWSIDLRTPNYRRTT